MKNEFELNALIAKDAALSIGEILIEQGERHKGRAFTEEEKEFIRVGFVSGWLNALEFIGFVEKQEKLERN